MSDSAALLETLGRVRRRLRFQRALQGAAVGGIGALAVLGVRLALAKLGVAVGPSVGFGTLLLVGAISGGAAAGALIRIPLSRCARAVDRASGTDANGDRTLSALLFCQGGEASPFMAAAIRDAAARALAVPVAAAAPVGMPRAMRPLAIVSAIVIGLSLLPARQRAARASLPPPTQGPGAPRLRLDPASIDAEREEAAAARAAAAALGDEELAKLAKAMSATLADLTSSGLPRGEALDRLSELQREADEAAAETERLRRAMDEAGKTLEQNPASRETGQAMQDEEAAKTDAAQKAMQAMAEKAAAASAAARNKLSATLDKAGQDVGRRVEEGQKAGAEKGDKSPGDKADSTAEASREMSSPSGSEGAAGGDEERQRRLARENSGDQGGASSSGAQGGKRDRQLQRLERDMKEAAVDCRKDPEACRQALDRAAEDLPKMENEMSKLAPRQRFAKALRQMRERLRRGGDGSSDQQRAERMFRRAARGKAGQQGQGQKGQKGQQGQKGQGQPGEGGEQGQGEGDEEGGQEGQGEGEGQEGSGLLPGQGQGEGAGEMPGEGQGRAQGSGDGQSRGDGIGNEAGDKPLGAKGDLSSRGHEREAKVKNGGGPSRSEVIEGAARRGFANNGYKKVFGDYGAVVEESLDATAVPAGRRYVVRRYFQLIRPR